jgi:hypothetical protein
MNSCIRICIIVPASLFAHVLFPASLFAHVFLNLPTVHTYSTYILYVLCWSFPPLYLLMFFISTYCTYLFYVHTVSALLIVPASLFAHVFCIYLLYFVETCSHVENYFLPQPKNWRSRLFICSCIFASTYCTYFFYLHTVRSLLCWPSCFILLMFFCIYLLYILNTVRALLVIPASLFAHVFLNLPTVHTYSTYIL